MDLSDQNIPHRAVELFIKMDTRLWAFRQLNCYSGFWTLTAVHRFCTGSKIYIFIPSDLQLNTSDIFLAMWSCCRICLIFSFFFKKLSFFKFNDHHLARVGLRNTTKIFIVLSCILNKWFHLCTSGSAHHSALYIRFGSPHCAPSCLSR